MNLLAQFAPHEICGIHSQPSIAKAGQIPCLFSPLFPLPISLKLLPDVVSWLSHRILLLHPLVLLQGAASAQAG